MSMAIPPSQTEDNGLRKKCGGVSASISRSTRSSRSAFSVQTHRGTGIVELRNVEDSPDNLERGACVYTRVHVC